MGRDRERQATGPIASRLLPVALSLLVAACASSPPTAPAASGGIGHTLPIFDASDALAREWRYFRVWGETDWRLVAVDGEVAIRAVGNGTSSGLARWIDIDTDVCPAVEWSWRVDRMPERADLAGRDREDVAASLLFLFGDPGTLANPEPVPTLRYAWATGSNPLEAVIDSPYLPGTLRTLVVRSGTAELGAWTAERRAIREDYERAFGGPPPGPVRMVVLFTDNDHGAEPTEAYYRRANALCREEVGEASIF